MKRALKLLFVLLLATVFLTACAGRATSMAVQLPPELVAVVGMLVMVGLTAVFKWIGSKIGKDLSDAAAVIASALSSVIVLAINYGLGLIPAAYDNFISALFSFLIVFLGGAGFYSLVLRKKSA